MKLVRFKKDNNILSRYGDDSELEERIFEVIIKSDKLLTGGI